MKGNGSVSNKMINRNWVLKRKRRKIPCGTDTSSGREHTARPLETNGSSKRRVKNKSTLVHASSKKKGNDGYYYECVVCDLGGKLLCCESCPRTYHIECLDPPLKRVPLGKWQCPNCSRGSNSTETTNLLEPISKRARSNIVIGKSKNANKSSSSEKGSHGFGSSISMKKRSSGKGKSFLDRRAKADEEKLDSPCTDESGNAMPIHSSHDGLMERCSSDVNILNEKKPECFPTETPADKKLISPGGGVLSSSGNMDSPRNEEACGSRPDLPSNNGSPRNKLTSLLGGCIHNVRKRKHKVHVGNIKKKFKSDNGECSGDASRKCGSKNSISRGSSKSHQKCKTVDPNPSSLSKEDDTLESIEVQLKDEMVPTEALHVSHGLHDVGNIVVESLASEGLMGEVQQVDRVLGCRVQEDRTNSSSQISLTNANDPSSSKKLVILDIQSGPPKKNPCCETTTDGQAVKDFTKESQNIVSHSDGGKNVKRDAKVNTMQVYRRSMTKKNRENAMELMKRNMKGSSFSAVTVKTQCDYVASTDDIAKTTEKISTRESGDANLRSHDNVEVSKHSEISDPLEIEEAKDVEMEIRISRSPEADVKESIPMESASANGEGISYEFYVKWVGKSHIHNSWVSESQLKVLAKRKLENYKAKYGTSVINICEDRWKLPQRVIALHYSVSGLTDVFVKWTGLPYDECTWESIDEPTIAKSSHLIDLYNQFECQALGKYASEEDAPSSTRYAWKNELAPLTEQPIELQGGSLFPHQLEALNWLRKCWYKSKNVILADEMGLGKTVSACAFMSSLYFEFKVKLPCLVLVPLSTMPNWMAEFALWAPNLNVVEYHGSAKARALIRQYEWHASDPSGLNKKTYKFNVLLTTYEMVLVDASHLRGIPWEVLVVDEGHRLKNASSKLFSLLNTFSFQHRVLLTGTPLQNNLGEMYNLLNFLQPVSFPSLSSFEENFNDLTTAEKVEELKKLVAPHMLRRLKKDAMQNIPPKTERMVPVELSSIQAEYYRAMLTKNYQILRNIGKGVPQQSMLNIVMQLRKVCNHPYLIPGTEPDTGSVEFLHEMRIKASAKLTLLHSMLKILYKEGHKILIFSQMTKLLDILEDYLTVEFGPKTFERVDGSVSVADRQTAIARFNQDKSRFVFLLSTRSCGLGINLATADTVIIYDSDFNPHADIQAMNRAHRIGQSNRLLVYRLVVRASVEERILQLAKKKLMLDQLFVNKSGSQKEVEDILRWGTEELFGDSSSMPGKDGTEDQRNNVETVTETEHKHKRRAGGLGDVYEDKCTEGRTKIFWDENAIIKLLDRSNLQSGSPDNAEGDLENDMLGSIKSVEWNEEITEDQGGIEPIPAAADDTSAHNSGKKEDDLVHFAEENEWDRLLRMRWEKHQNEEEAALGRGKRQRKAVSYREAYTSHPSETLSESGDEEDRQPEPEPEWEYTPAGRVLKEKYAKLRARQKERLAQRNAIETTQPVDGLSISESLVQISVSNARDESPMLPQPVEARASVIDLKDDICGETPEVTKNKMDLASGLEKILKHKPGENLDLPAKPVRCHSPDVSLPGHRLQVTSYTNSLPNSNLLPVLGLCAPNANQMESSQRNFSRAYSRQNRQGVGHDFPFHLASCSGIPKDMTVKGHETVPDKFKQPDITLEASQQRLSSSIPENYLPFGMHPSSIPQRNGSVCSENPSKTYTDFQEKMSLPKLPFDDKLLPKYPFPARSFPPPRPDLFPGLSLGSRNDSIRDLPTMPLLPNLKFPQEHAPKYNQQEGEMPLMLGLGPTPHTFSTFPENHRKVLENIMMRTGSASNNLFRTAKTEFWTDNELDHLWIGVRRHGRGSWDAMLRDPRLKFSKFKTAEDLSARWEEEQHKLFDGPSLQGPNSYLPMKSSKSALFPNIPDEMMPWALHGSRFHGPSKFQSHLTDMKLGFGDVAASLPHLNPPDQLSLQNEHILPIPSSNVDRSWINLFGDSSSGPSDLLNSFGSGSDSHSLNYWRNFSPQQKGEKGISAYGKLPSFLNNSFNVLHASLNTGNGDLNSSALVGDSSNFHSKEKDEVGESSSAKNKLPHWLREAVNAPVKPTERDLPPTISAIAHSVRLLYGEENTTIPPFVAPGPSPSQPRDPRWSLKKKKRKSRAPSHLLLNIAGSSQNFKSNLHDDNGVLSTVPLAPEFPLAPQSAAGSSGHKPDEPKINVPPLNLNVIDLSTSSVYPDLQNKMSTSLSPSPEVLQLVASCVASLPVPDMTNSSYLENNITLPKSFEQGGLEDSRDAYRKRKAKLSSPLHASGPFSNIVDLDHADSEDSSKTQSDPTLPKKPDEEEVSSEGTVSDHQAGNHEP